MRVGSQRPPPPPPAQVDLLLPLHLLLIAGLATETDYVASALDALPRTMDVARDLSLGGYLLQAPVAKALQLWAGWPSEGFDALHMLAVLPILGALAALVQYGVQAPFARLLKRCLDGASRDGAAAGR